MAFVPRASRHQMLIAVADAALHDVTAAVSWVLVASVASTRGVRAVSLSFALKEELDIILCVEESTTGEFATFAFALAFSFSFAAKVLLEEAAKSPYGFASEASPGFPGHSVLVE